eukprot:scaffold162153_cov55-Attheya_sp.AAC.3
MKKKQHEMLTFEPVCTCLQIAHDVALALPNSLFIKDDSQKMSGLRNMGRVKSPKRRSSTTKKADLDDTT